MFDFGEYINWIIVGIIALVFAGCIGMMIYGWIKGL